MNQHASKLPHPLLRSRTRRLRSCCAGRIPPRSTQRVVRLEQALAPRYQAWLAYENQHRREHLCRCQSASPRQPEADQREHRIRPPSLYRHRHGWRCPARCAPGIGFSAAADRDSLDIARQVPGALARRRLRLRAAGTDAQAARHRLRRRSRLHRLQPGAPRPRFPQSQVRSRPPRHGRISRRFHLDSRRLPAGCWRGRCAALPHRDPARQAAAKAQQFGERLGMGFRPACPRQRRREADAGAWLRAAPTSPILSTTPSAPSISLRPASGCSKASASTT